MDSRCILMRMVVSMTTTAKLKCDTAVTIADCTKGPWSFPLFLLCHIFLLSHTFVDIMFLGKCMSEMN